MTTILDQVRGSAPQEVRAAPALFDEAHVAYASGSRAYHDFRHVREVLRHYDGVARDVRWLRPNDVYLALLFHDAVYVPGAGDNESRSAALARSAIAAHLPRGAADADRVAALIQLTARHGHVDAVDVDPDARLFLDCDMAILGALPGAFDAYDAAIAREYAHVPSALYVAGRRVFFERLLGRPRIFLSDYFHAKLDVCARANIGRALAASPLGA